MLLMATPTMHSTRDNVLSPANYCPPPQAYDSPMLTPSPLKQRRRDPSPAQALPRNPFFAAKPQPISPNDEDGSIFRSPPPLLTPVKHAHRVPHRAVLSARTINTMDPPVKPASRQPLGMKRKSMPHCTQASVITPPLRTTQSKSIYTSPSFDHIAPLPPFQWGDSVHTPQTRAETDTFLRRQTASLTKLRLSDAMEDDDEFGGHASDSGCEMDEDDTGHLLFLSQPSRGKRLTKSVTSHALKGKGKGKEEVAEAISPGGHVVKRRARSRPVSTELQVLKSPKSPSKHKTNAKTNAKSTHTRPRITGLVSFPSAMRGRTTPSPPSTIAHRRRTSGPTPFRPPAPPVFKPQASPSTLQPRAPLARLDSAATLFFGPRIPTTEPPRQRTNNLFGDSPPPLSRIPLFPVQHTRHSYAGSSDDTMWNTMQIRNHLPSPPGTSPLGDGPPRRYSMDVDMDDEEMFFSGNDTSFEGKMEALIPALGKTRVMLPTKYREDEAIPSTLLNTSTSSSANNAFDDDLVTPHTTGTSLASAWPTPSHDYEEFPSFHNEDEIDAFIRKTLAESSKGSHGQQKRPPGTPVKKARLAFIGNDRPWQSAIASKIGVKEDCDFAKAGRKSLPPVFAEWSGKKAFDTDTEDDEQSPSVRRDKEKPTYQHLGIGQPAGVTRNRWVARRSSSGAFSSGSESPSLANTPTRGRGEVDWQLGKTRLPLRFCPSTDGMRSASGSSTCSGATNNSPTLVAKRGTVSTVRAPRRSIVSVRRYSEPLNGNEQPGRFASEFDEIEEVGAGEFGKVIKAESKCDGKVYAIKKSKRFEGTKHRLRLREEVTVLQHLRQSSPTSSGHANVLEYVESWEEDETLYIQTELCECGNLGRFLWEYGRTYGKLDEARVWKVIVDLSNGLGFIHEHGVVHLDLKPANVFVTKEGRLKIGDFGMATMWPRRVGDAGFEREGDKLYLAPEVLQGAYGPAADVFSFGMTILETASNIVVPDQGEGWHRLRQEDFSQVGLLCEEDQPELVGLIRGTMRTRPEDRLTMAQVCAHPVVRRAQERMGQRTGWASSALSAVEGGFLADIVTGSVDVPDN